MGWWGYGIYDGDDTITQQYDFLCNAKICEKTDEGYDYYLENYYGKIKSKEDCDKLVQNQDMAAKKLPKKIILGHNVLIKGWDDDEDRAIAWQMFVALFVDNNLPIKKGYAQKGIEATEFLKLAHAKQFINVGARIKHLNTFIKKVKKLKKI